MFSAVPDMEKSTSSALILTLKVHQEDPRRDTTERMIVKQATHR